MTTNSVSNYLKYANLQMAAEADLGKVPVSGKIAKDTLTTGKNVGK